MNTLRRKNLEKPWNGRGKSKKRSAGANFVSFVDFVYKVDSIDETKRKGRLIFRIPT